MRPRYFAACAFALSFFFFAGVANAQALVGAQNPTIVRIEQAAPFKLDQGGTKSVWETILPGLIAAFAGLGGALVGGWIGLRSSAAAINQKGNEAELAEIRSKLDGFFGPFMRRSQEGLLLSQELVSRQPDKETFRTIVKLLDPKWLQSASKADQTIVTTIVENGLALRSIIRDSAGAVDPSISEYLARAATHFTMLNLAKEGALEDDPKRFGLYVFPTQLDEVLEREVCRLNARVDILRSAPSKTHPALLPLQIPKHLELPLWPKSGRVLAQEVSTPNDATLKQS